MVQLHLDSPQSGTARKPTEAPQLAEHRAPPTSTLPRHFMQDLSPRDLLALGVAPVTASVDTSASVDLVLSAQLALSTETITLENYEVWVTP